MCVCMCCGNSQQERPPTSDEEMYLMYLRSKKLHLVKEQKLSLIHI